MNDGQRKTLREHLECDFSFAVPNLALRRVNLPARTAPARCSDHDSSKVLSSGSPMPRYSKEIAGNPRHRAGHRTDRLGQIDHPRGHRRLCNENHYGHILTVGDPVGIRSEAKRCLINQREVGPLNAVVQQRLALGAARGSGRHPGRRDARPRDHPSRALTAAETGHLVFGTLHTSSAAKTIDRIVDVFPAAGKDMVRSMLSDRCAR